MFEDKDACRIEPGCARNLFIIIIMIIKVGFLAPKASLPLFLATNYDANYDAYLCGGGLTSF
jgi:hypothetical protein